MAKIYNSDLMKGMANNAGIEINRDKVPNELAEKVVPTMETNPFLLREQNQLASSFGNATGAISITAASLGTNDKRVFLTGIFAGYVKNAACDIASGKLNITIISKERNALSDVISFPILTLTAQEQTTYLEFKRPIELAKDSTIIFNGTYAAGAATRTMNIFGYTLNTTN